MGTFYPEQRGCKGTERKSGKAAGNGYRVEKQHASDYGLARFLRVRNKKS